MLEPHPDNPPRGEIAFMPFADPNFDTAKSWHLAEDSQDASVTDFEFALMQVYEAYQRYAVALARLVGESDLNFNEVVALHVVRMQERAKDAATIAQLVNREDLPNVLYNLRKLVSLGLVEKIKSGTATYFRVTEQGRLETQRYADLRNQVLLGAFARTPNMIQRMAEVEWTLDLMAGMYDSAAREVASINPEVLFVDEPPALPSVPTSNRRGTKKPPR